jgi:hypothetical protein
MAGGVESRSNFCLPKQVSGGTMRRRRQVGLSFPMQTVAMENPTNEQ